MGPTKKERSQKRQLVRWSDDLDKQVLLAVQYTCNEAGVRIPWDDVATLMGDVTGEPKFTGGAIIQHLSKLRSKMESHSIRVPPALRRGTIVKTPSKIYAAANKLKSASSTAKTTKAGNVKSKKAKSRNLESEEEDDSDDIPVEYREDEDDDSDGEYGSAKKKRRVSSGKGKAKRQPAPAAAEKEEDDDEEVKTPEVKTPEVKTTTIKADAVKEGSLKVEGDVQASIESPSPMPRTRGVKHNYTKMDMGSDENEDAEGDAQAEEEVEDEEYVKEEFKSDREISPRTKIETPVAEASGFLDLASDSTHRYSDAGFALDFGSGYHFGQSLVQQQPYLTQQYQMPAQTGLGLPHSTGTSFSTSRTGSMASLTSAMAPPAAQYVNPGSYGPILNNDKTTSTFDDDGIMYGGQHISPTSFPPSSFYGNFDNTFS